MRFVGTTDAKLDAKGRVFLPSDFRKQLAGSDQQLVLKRDVYQPCLVLYPYSVWNAEVDMLRAKLNRWDPRQAMLFRQFLSDIECFTLDANGRFIVPRRFIEVYGITDRCIRFIGVDDRIELWSVPKAEACFMTDDDYAQTLATFMAGDAPQNWWIRNVPQINCETTMHDVHNLTHNP